MCDVPQMLLDIYGQLRNELQEGIQNFKIAVINFDTEFNERGPMVKGLKPSEAADKYVIIVLKLYNFVKFSLCY